jgi:hypothetical protein
VIPEKRKQLAILTSCTYYDLATGLSALQKLILSTYLLVYLALANEETVA